MQIDKHKAKYIITAYIPIIIIKTFLLFVKKIYNYVKKNSSPHNYKKKILIAKYKNGKHALNFSLNGLRLIAEHRNISDYEIKSAKDLIKALRGSKPRLGIKKSKRKEIEEDFYNLRHAFSKKDADKYRKRFL